jgi:hypothetical protein
MENSLCSLGIAVCGASPQELKIEPKLVAGSKIFQ